MTNYWAKPFEISAFKQPSRLPAVKCRHNSF